MDREDGRMGGQGQQGGDERAFLDDTGGKMGEEQRWELSGSASTLTVTLSVTS